jgi:hypothetical protein
MGLEAEAANLRAPFDSGSNEFGVKKFTATTTHAAHAVPKQWCGRYVRVTVVGGDLHFGFSTSSSAEIDTSVSATAAGASAKVGDFLADGEVDQVVIPSKNPDETMYFVREASASCTVYMRLASGPPLVV